MLAGFGDSIMKGVVLRRLTVDGRAEYELAGQSLVERCAQRLGMTAVDYARFGCTTPVGEKLVERYAGRLDAEQSVLLCYGGNDSDYDWQAIADHPTAEHTPKTELSVFEATYERIIARIRNTGATPYIVSLPPMDAVRYFRFVTRNMSEGQRDNVLRWLGGDVRRITAGHELYDRSVRRIAEETSTPLLECGDAFVADAAPCLCEDGIHPNDKGLTYLADRLSDRLISLAA